MMDTQSPDALARQLFFIVVAGVIVFITAVTALFVFSAGVS